MSATGENAQVICAIMDAQMTSAEFDSELARHRLLAECKAKGFARLATLGHFDGI